MNHPKDSRRMDRTAWMLLTRGLIAVGLVCGGATGALLGQGEPYLVRDITPGADGSKLRDPVAVRNRLTFLRGRGELWVSDGSAGRAMLIGRGGFVDEEIGGEEYYLYSVIGDQLAIGAHLNPGNGESIEDVYLANLETGDFGRLGDRLQLPASWSARSLPIELGDQTILAADDGEHGVELWVMNGTNGGASLVADLRPGIEGSWPRGLYLVQPGVHRFLRVGDRVLFLADTNQGVGLWSTDGSNAGTVLLQPGYDPYLLGEVQNLAVIWLLDERQVLITNGTRDGTRVIDALDGRWINLFSSASSGRQIYFSVGESVDGNEGWSVWRTDGSVPGTARIGHRASGANVDVPALGDGAFYRGQFLFPWADQLWSTNGTPEGTGKLSTDGICFPSLEFYNQIRFISVGERVLLFHHDPEAGSCDLWRTDFSCGDTQLLRRFLEPYCWGPGLSVTSDGDRIYFSANDDVHGQELWSSDGTEAGTRVYDIAPGPVGSSSGWSYSIPLENTSGFPSPAVVEAGGHVFFTADDGVHGRELWALPLGDIPTPPRFLRANTNADQALDLSDAIATLTFLFSGGQTPPCLDAADANDSGLLDLSDGVYTLGYLFLGTAEPPAPFGECGEDPTEDGLPCKTGILGCQ